jgi:uncharacterized protein (DUF2384 family)
VTNPAHEHNAAKALLVLIFGDEAKALLWLKTPNPMLGGIIPSDMIYKFGRGNTLIKFMINQIQEGGALE